MVLSHTRPKLGSLCPQAFWSPGLPACSMQLPRSLWAGAGLWRGGVGLSSRATALLSRDPQHRATLWKVTSCPKPRALPLMCCSWLHGAGGQATGRWVSGGGSGQPGVGVGSAGLSWAAHLCSPDLPVRLRLGLPGRGWVSGWLRSGGGPPSWPGLCSDVHTGFLGLPACGRRAHRLRHSACLTALCGGCGPIADVQEGRLGCPWGGVSCAGALLPRGCVCSQRRAALWEGLSLYLPRFLWSPNVTSICPHGGDVEQRSEAPQRWSSGVVFL